MSIRAFVCLIIACLVGSACQLSEKDKPWTMTTLSGDSLDSLHQAQMRVFVPKGQQKHRLEMFLLHDNQTETTSISLNISLIGKYDTVCQVQQELSLVSKTGTWIGQGLLYHEVDLTLLEPIYIEYPGIYSVNVYSTTKPTPRGINLVACRLMEELQEE